MEVNENLFALRQNPYPGRGIILGRTPDGDLVQIYWLMGRRESSRNRVLKLIEGRHNWVETCVANPSKVTGDPSLLLYTAMAEAPGIYVVSNGAQTQSVLGDGIISMMHSDWQYEPDAPNFTPRIGGVIKYLLDGKFSMSLAMLRKSPFGKGCDRFLSNYDEIAPGFGYFISTYERDGDPVPSFRGEPKIIPIEMVETEEIAKYFWSILDPNNRVSLAVKIIPIDDRPSEIYIINRHTV